VRYLALALNLKEVILSKREFEPFKIALSFKVILLRNLMILNSNKNRNLKMS